MKLKKGIFKNLITFSIILTILFPNYVLANNFNPKPVANTPGFSEKVCVTPTVQEFFPLGDTRGKSVLTKREYVRDCNVTVTEQGKCIEWENKEVTRSLTLDDYNSYETENYSDSLGRLLATLGAYDQIGHLWSGWKGYCEIGVKSDFSWAKDPMFWASMAMSFVMSATQSSAEIKVGDKVLVESQKGLLQDTAVGNAINSTSEAIGESVKSGMESLKSSFTEAFPKLSENVGGAMTWIGDKWSSAKSSIFGESASKALSGEAKDLAVKEAQRKALNSVGRCIIGAAADTLSTLYEFAQDGSGDLTCDPVDEVCQDEVGNQTGDGMTEKEIMTMDETKFNDLVKSFENDPQGKRNIYDYVEVIKIENGVVTYRMKDLNQIPGANDITNMDQLNKMKEQMRETKLKMGLAINAMSFAGCLGQDGATGAPSQAGEGKGDRADIRKFGSMAIDQAAKFLGPYGPVVALVAKLVLYTATSFQNIDTCHNEDDAKEAGLRHERTQKAIKFNLCHFVEEECVDNNVLASIFKGKGGCTLTGYWHCCYDQILTKVLVEQLKAQLGRDYAHCTGITLRDLNYVSLRQCSKAEMASGIDGAHQRGKYNPKDAFQYKHKCVDMSEFLAYLETTIGTEVTMDDFKTFWNDMSRQGIESGISRPIP